MALKRSQPRAGKKVTAKARPPLPAAKSAIKNAAKVPAKPALNGKSKLGKKAAAKGTKPQAAKKSAKIAAPEKKSLAKKSARKLATQQSLPFWSELLDTSVGGIPEQQPAQPYNTESNTDNEPSSESENTMSAATLTPKKSIEELAINTIRTLSMDGVQAANSGHPGTPMALAPIAYTIWQNEMRYDPADPT